MVFSEVCVRTVNVKLPPDFLKQNLVNEVNKRINPDYSCEFDTKLPSARF